MHEIHVQLTKPTQDKPRMGTARVKEEEEADARLIAIEELEIRKKGTGSL